MAPRSGSDVAGQQGGTTDDYRGDRMSGQPGQTGTGTGTGTGTDTGTGMETGTQPEMGMTEFAALDTNSDGRIQEEDWRPELVNGLEFDEVDLDGSGDIDQQEFEQAMAQQSGQTGRSSTDTEMGTETETEDPTGS